MTETKTKKPRRSPAEIAADYEQRAADAKQRAKLASTKGLKEIHRAEEALIAAIEACEGSEHAEAVSDIHSQIVDLIDKLEA